MFVLGLKASSWIAPDEGKMSQALWRSVCVWRPGACQPSIEHQRVRSLISYCYAFFYFYSILNLLLVICGVNPKSCSRSYVHFCVPWILDDFSNDPCTGTTSDFDCCLHWLSGCVGKCCYSQAMILMRCCRLGILAIMSVDGCYLYIIIHNCILHVTWL